MTHIQSPSAALTLFFTDTTKQKHATVIGTNNGILFNMNICPFHSVLQAIIELMAQEKVHTKMFRSSSPIGLAFLRHYCLPRTAQPQDYVLTTSQKHTHSMTFCEHTNTRRALSRSAGAPGPTTEGLGQHPSRLPCPACWAEDRVP